PTTVLGGPVEVLPGGQPTVNVRKLAPGYLRAMHIPIVRGRDVAGSDSEALLVSQSAAKMLWGDVDPVGRRVTLPLEAKGVSREVVGITGDVRLGSLTTDTPPAAVYEFTRHEFGNFGFSLGFALP